MRQYQTFILYISAVIFGKGPFLRTLYLKKVPNPIISQIIFLWRLTSGLNIAGSLLVVRLLQVVVLTSGLQGEGVRATL